MTRGNAPIRWVLLDETGGAPAQDGTVLSPSILAHIAEAVTIQLNRDWGSDSSMRAGSNPTDIQPGERVYTFKATLPDAPGAEAYHAIDGSGVEFAMEAWSTCSSALGPGGGATAASHEAIETEGDRGCNEWADDWHGTLHAKERCDAVEVQSYPITCSDATVVYVSNWLLDAWYIPGASGPFTFMGANGIDGAVEPPGPMQTAAGDGGNYQSVEDAPGNATQVTASRARRHRIEGTPRKPEKVEHWSSRASKRARRGVAA